MAPHCDQLFEVPRQPDGEAFYIHFTGGIRAAKVDDGQWRMEPVLVDAKPCLTEPLSMEQLRAISKQGDFRPVAFHRFGWSDGEYHSTWSPIIPGKSKHLVGPSDLWGNIAGNLSRLRTAAFSKDAKSLDLQKIAEVMDDQEPIEALAQYISLSLRSMDICVEQISECYNEQLVNHLAAGLIDGQQAANTTSQLLYAHVHSFFLHFGAARDYLATMIARRLGPNFKRVDSMRKLVCNLRSDNLPRDALLDVLFARGEISEHPTEPGKFQVSGWMREVTQIRNDFVHRRPYGSKFAEHFGSIVPADGYSGLYRYYRPIDLKGSAEQDVFDILHRHYEHCLVLFDQAAQAAGNDVSAPLFTGSDIISIEVTDKHEAKP